MTDATKTALDGLMTLTGENLIGALNALDEKLPDGAYREVSIGGRKFTDISPAYSTEAITAHFGPLGIGWGYEVTDEHQTGPFTTNSGKQFVGVVLRVRLWYAYRDGDETKRIEWDTYGGNANSGAAADEHFSWQGALTNAIGKGWSLQGFQRTVYKGEDYGMEERTGDENRAKPYTAPSRTPGRGITSKQAGMLVGKAKDAGYTRQDVIKTAATKYGIAKHEDGKYDLCDLTREQMDALIEAMTNHPANGTVDQAAAMAEAAADLGGEFVAPAEGDDEIPF